MALFTSTLSQMGVLVTLLGLGFLLTRLGILKKEAAGILSKMENYLFLPALVLSTFSENFTLERLGSSWQFALAGVIVAILCIPTGLILAKVLARNEYDRKIYSYSLMISNFGFMGNAVVLALFPDMFMEYIIFTIPFSVLIYTWAIPYFLIPRSHTQGGFMGKLKSLANPTLIVMLVGILIGLVRIPIPSFLNTVITNLGSCMSPIAMLLTGITVATIPLKTVLTDKSVYILSALRLAVLPLIAVGILLLLPVPSDISLCIICYLAMPLGLNTVVIPSAYGQDTTSAAGMALVSHVLSCATIPLIFLLAQSVL